MLVRRILLWLLASFVGSVGRLGLSMFATSRL